MDKKPKSDNIFSLFGKWLESPIDNRNAYNIISATISFLFLVVGLFILTYKNHKTATIDFFSLNRESSIKTSELYKRLDSLKQQVDNLSTTVGALKNQNASSRTVDYIELQASITSLNRRLNVIENAILDSPEKALTIPLMRRDLDNYIQGHTTRINDLSQNIANTANQIYTVIGTVLVVLSLGIWTTNRAKKEQ